MALGFAGHIIRILLIILNLIVSLAGLGLVIIGIWFLVDDEAVHALKIVGDSGTMHMIKAAAVTILVVGFFALFIGVIGCWGSFRQKTSCLNIFAVIICLIILLEIVGAILAGVFHSKVTKTLKKSMNETLQKDYGRIDYDYVTKGWNRLQYDFSCCGVEGPEDWLTSFWKSNQTDKNATVPLTCCVLKNDNLTDPRPKNKHLCYTQALINTTTEDYVHHQGCEVKLESWVSHHVYILIGIAVAVIIVEVLVVALACILRKRISDGYEYV